jgi:beta-galactosidase
MTRKAIFTLILALTFLPAIKSQPKFDNLLYGVAYYHEYMPEERLDKDIELMKKAGVSVVRIGESSWGLWEPKEGVFDYSWMDRIVAKMQKAGIKMIMGTPTYSIPAWLFRIHPEIQVKRINEQRTSYGLRQQADLTHPTYRFYCERVIRKICEHYKDNPAIVGYQIDNETTSAGTADRNVYLSFIDYLKNKFKSIDTLNRVWGFNYWGQRVNDWEELAPRDGMINPGYKLEWERFQQKIVADFLAFQYDIVNEYKRKDQFICQDFAGGLLTGVNQFEVAKHLDIVATNSYTDMQERYNGEAASVAGDFSRSLKQSNYLVTETNAQTIGWNSAEQYPPFDGQLRLNMYAHFASGANMVEYWHWHSIHYGQETYWKGILGHDLQPNRVFNEMCENSAEINKFGTHLVNLKKTNKVAILYSIDSYHGIQCMPFETSTCNYMSVLMQYYRLLFQMNVEVDFVFPETKDFSQYQLVLVPPLYIASNSLLTRLTNYVKDGGNLVMGFKSGFCDENSQVRHEVMPGIMRKAAGFYYQEFSNFKNFVPLKGDPYHVGETENKAAYWCDMLIPETAKTLATYDHPFFGKYPAVARNQYGKGSLLYLSSYFWDATMQKILEEELKFVGMETCGLKAPLIVREGVNQFGKKIHYIMNFSMDEQNFAYPFNNSNDLRSGKKLSKNEQVKLKPWDLIIAEE